MKQTHADRRLGQGGQGRLGRVSPAQLSTTISQSFHNTQPGSAVHCREMIFSTYLQVICTLRNNFVVMISCSQFFKVFPNSLQETEMTIMSAHHTDRISHQKV